MDKISKCEKKNRKKIKNKKQRKKGNHKNKKQKKNRTKKTKNKNPFSRPQVVDNSKQEFVKKNREFFIFENIYS